MGKTDGERLKRWRKKQRERGRRHISFMLSLKATSSLEKIQKDTGESAAGVIDRLLTQGTLPIAKTRVPGIKLDVIAEVTAKVSQEKQVTLDLIKELREKHQLSHNNIADYLNKQGVATFGKGEKWGQGQIGKRLKAMGIK